MSRDKKNQRGQDPLRPAARLGHVELTDAPRPEDVREVVAALCR